MMLPREMGWCSHLYLECLLRLRGRGRDREFFLRDLDAVPPWLFQLVWVHSKSVSVFDWVVPIYLSGK